MRTKQNAQQFVEYLMLFAVVVVILIWFIGPTGPFRDSVNRMIELSLNEIERETVAMNIEE